MLKQLPLISIIIPVYNVEKYISKCIYSVIDQTYKDKIECLIINDCTKDKSIDIVESIIQKSHKKNIIFKIISHRKNKGLSAARNTGIKESTGDYLYFLDSDDYIIPECIELMSDILRKYPKAEIVQAGAISNKFKEFSLKDKRNLPEYTEDKKWIKCSFLKKNVFPVTSWNKLVKKKFIIDNDLYFKENIIHEDEHWNYFLCKKLESIAFCLKDTYFYVERDSSIMSTVNNSKSINSRLIILDDFIDNIDYFCKNEQIAHIFSFLHYMYVFYPIPTSLKSGELLKKLSCRCGLIGKITIMMILHTPKILNKRKVFYDSLINHLLLPYF